MAESKIEKNANRLIDNSQEWISNVDCNDFKITGFYCLNTNISNAPTNLETFILFVIAPNPAIVKQFTIKYNATQTYIRQWNGTTWSPWSKFAEIQTKSINGTTDANGLISTGVAFGQGILSCKNMNLPNTIYTPIVSNSYWHLRVTDTSGSIRANTSVSGTVLYC